MDIEHFRKVARGEAQATLDSAFGRLRARAAEHDQAREQLRVDIVARQPEADEITQNARRLQQEGGSSFDIAMHNRQAIELEPVIAQFEEQGRTLEALGQQLVVEYEQLNADFKAAYLELEDLTKQASGWNLGPAAVQREVRIRELQQTLRLLVGGSDGIPEK